MRGVSSLLLLAYVALLFAPACIVTDFLLERDHIVRDLCVQRMVVEGKRTCHGDCYLMRKLGRSEEREKGLPNELRELRMDEAVFTSTVEGPSGLPKPLLDVRPAPVHHALLPGCVPPPDHVPWG